MALREAVDATAAEVRRRAQREENVHLLLAELLPIPYYEMKELLQGGADRSPRNPGPIGGVFFERFVAAAVQGRILDSLPGTAMALNAHLPGYPSGLPRQPDIHLSRGGRHVVLECKTSPKKSDIEGVLEMQSHYASSGCAFYFIAGEPVGRASQLHHLASLPWVTILMHKGVVEHPWHGSSRSLDDILNDCLAYLRAT